MTIYVSTKVLPYVYRLDHPVTGEFYIGVRVANKVPSDQDLGEFYFTSSKYVKPRFSEFHFQILAEFFDIDSAYQFEQELINEFWKWEGSLNKTNHCGKRKFFTAGVKAKPKSKSTIKKLSDARKERKAQVCRIFDKKEMWIENFNRWANGGMSAEGKEKCRQTHLGKAKKKVVCRIFDGREMTLSQFVLWCNGGMSPEVKDKLSKGFKFRTRQVCRIEDKKEMFIQNFLRWANGTSSEIAAKISHTLKTSRRDPLL